MNTPSTGFYYHYKHDPTGPVNDHAYKVLGVAKHSEDDSVLVIYQPLYKSDYFNGANFSARPLEMFTGTVTVGENEVERFKLITDLEVIKALKAFVN